MAKKIGFLLGLGAGYVLGARAGRQRYEQIAEKAKTVWRDPRVQEKAGQAQDMAKERAGQAGSVVKEKAEQAGSAVASKVSEKTSGGGDSSGSSGGSSSSSSSGGSSSGGGQTGVGSTLGGGITNPAADEHLSEAAESGSDETTATPNDMPSHGTPPDSPSAKLPPNPVAEPGNPGGSPS